MAEITDFPFFILASRAFHSLEGPLRAILSCIIVWTTELPALWSLGGSRDVHLQALCIRGVSVVAAANNKKKISQ